MNVQTSLNPADKSSKKVADAEPENRALVLAFLFFFFCFFRFISKPIALRQEWAFSEGFAATASIGVCVPALTSCTTLLSVRSSELSEDFDGTFLHLLKNARQGIWRAAAGTAAACMAATQKAAVTATAATAAVAATQKAVKAQPVDTFEEGTRKSRKTANTILPNKADKKLWAAMALKEARIAHASCKGAQEITAGEVCISVALVNQLSPKGAPNEGFFARRLDRGVARQARPKVQDWARAA